MFRLESFWQGIKESHSGWERTAKLIVFIVTVGGPLGVAWFAPDWWKIPLSWPRGVFLFVPLAMLLAYWLGKGYTSIRKPAIKASKIWQGRTSDNHVGFFLTVKNYGPGAVIPLIQVQPVEDMQGTRLSKVSGVSWVSGLAPVNSGPRLLEGTEDDAQIFSVTPLTASNPKGPSLTLHGSGIQGASGPLENQPELIMRIVILATDEAGRVCRSIRHYYEIKPGNDDLKPYSVTPIKRPKGRL